MPSSFQFSFLISLFILATTSLAIVPTSQTFKYVNQGPFGEYSVEYLADYRVLDIGNFPFTLCFYNSTPNAFILGLRMGHRRTESIMRWVWDANRGKPVRENATLSFGPEGNLVLADVDGKVTWQTGTANKGVVGLEVRPNGNMVLYDGKGKIVWQSFDHPTDTLLVGQALQATGRNCLVRSPPMGLWLCDGEKAFGYVFSDQECTKPLLYYMSLVTGKAH